MKNVSVKLFSFINGGSIGDEERVCQTLQFLQTLQYSSLMVEYWWSRKCLSNSRFFIKNVSVKISASLMEGVLVMKNVPVNSSASLLEGVLVSKNVSVKLSSFINGGSIGDQERVCQTLQLLQWKEYWWSRTCLSNSLVSSTEGVLVMKQVPVKLFC